MDYFYFVENTFLSEVYTVYGICQPNKTPRNMKKTMSRNTKCPVSHFETDLGSERSSLRYIVTPAGITRARRIDSNERKWAKMKDHTNPLLCARSRPQIGDERWHWHVLGSPTWRLWSKRGVLNRLGRRPRLINQSEKTGKNDVKMVTGKGLGVV